MSITFSYREGADSLDQFAKQHGDRPYCHLLYSRLGDLYVDKQRYQDGANTYRAFVKRDPNSEYAPLLAMQAIEAYQKGGFSQLVLEGKHDFVERYHLGSPFWQGRERAQYPQVVAGAEDQSARRGDVFSCAARKPRTRPRTTRRRRAGTATI